MRESDLTAGTDSHPDVDQWIAYHGGELGDADEQRLRSHLVRCRDCLLLVLDLESFVEPCEDDRTAVSELEMAAAWRAMKVNLAQEEESAPAIAAPRTRPPRWLDRRVPVPMALAASLLMGVLGLSLWSVEHSATNDLRGQLAVQATPMSNLVIRDLELNMATRSGSSPSPTRLRPDEFSALVMFPSTSFERYDVEVVDAEGQAVWSGSGVVPDPKLGTLTLGFPPGSLDAGDYRVRLFGSEPRTPLEDDLPIQVLLP